MHDQLPNSYTYMRIKIRIFYLTIRSSDPPKEFHESLVEYCCVSLRDKKKN
jgi:hypothetical protein